MEMTCGLGFGILLICFVQAELAGCSWVIDAQRPQNSNTNSGFPSPDGKLRKFSSNFQDQLNQGFFSPPSVQVQTSSFNTKPAAKSGYDRMSSTSGLTQPRSQGGSSAILFGPVGSGPRSSIRMQTSAQGRARKVPSGLASQGEKIRSSLPHAAAGRFYPSPKFALNTRGYRPRSLLTGLAAPRSGEEGESALRFAPVMVYDLPEAFGGSTIRRLKRPTEQETVAVQKQPQVYPPPQRVPLYKPERTSSRSGYDWSRMKPIQGPVQKPYWIDTPPRPQRAAASNPDLPSVHPASKWSKFKLPYRR